MVVVNGMEQFWLKTSLRVYAGSVGKSNWSGGENCYYVFEAKEQQIEGTRWIAPKDTEVFWNNGRCWV